MGAMLDGVASASYALGYRVDAIFKKGSNQGEV